MSAPSVVILTLAAGSPSSAPVIVRAAAVDSYRVSVSWEPGPFPNGPLLSYVLQLQGDDFFLLNKVHALPESNAIFILLLNKTFIFTFLVALFSSLCSIFYLQYKYFHLFYLQLVVNAGSTVCFILRFAKLHLHASQHD